VSVLALAGCASVEDQPAGTAQPGKAVSGRELNAKVRAAVARKPTVTAHLTGDVVGNGADGVLRLDRSNFGMAFEVRPPKGGAAMKMLALPQGYYISAGTKVEGKEWVKLVASQMDPISDMLGATVQAVQNSVSLDTLERTLLISQDVADFGPETVNGVKTTHYKMSMDAGAIKQQLPASLPPDQAQSLLDSASGYNDVYLDQDGLPIKVVSTVKTPNGTGASTVSYEKWGQPVTVSLPAPASVLDLASDHDVNALNNFLAKVTGQNPEVSPSVPDIQAP
jgi:hypothetical protein